MKRNHLPVAHTSKPLRRPASTPNRYTRRWRKAFNDIVPYMPPFESTEHIFDAWSWIRESANVNGWQAQVDAKALQPHTSCEELYQPIWDAVNKTTAVHIKKCEQCTPDDFDWLNGLPQFPNDPPGEMDDTGIQGKETD